MTESDLKRYLIKSIRKQGGLGHRVEDKYALGWPDLLMLPLGGPVFLIEAKLIKSGAKLVCTPAQGATLDAWHQPPAMLTGIVAYAERHERLFIGHQHDKLVDCASVARPARLDSGDWLISALLKQLDNAFQYGIVPSIRTRKRT